MIRVLATIDFYNEPSLDADEVRNKSGDWELSPEFGTLQMPVAQEIPKHQFGICRRVSQDASAWSSFARLHQPPSPAPAARPLPPAGEAKQETRLA